MEFLCPACQFVFTEPVALQAGKLACPRCGRTLRLPAWLQTKLTNEAEQTRLSNGDEAPALQSSPVPALTGPVINFPCLRCGRDLEADASCRGVAVTCPSCSATLAVPPDPAASIPVARLAPAPGFEARDFPYHAPPPVRAQPALLVDAGAVEQAVETAPFPKAIPVAQPLDATVEPATESGVVKETAPEEAPPPAKTHNPAMLVLGAFFILVLGAAAVVAIGVYIRPARNTSSANHAAGLDLAGTTDTARRALPRASTKPTMTPGEWQAFRGRNWPAKYAIAGYLSSENHWAFWNRSVTDGSASYGWDERVQEASLFPQWASGDNSAREWAESVAKEHEIQAVAIVDLFSHAQPSVVEWLYGDGDDGIQRSRTAPSPVIAESLARILEGLH